MEYKYPDIIIINSENDYKLSEYKLSKKILSNIPYFRTLFSSGFLESKQDIINVEFNDIAWKCIINKIYDDIQKQLLGRKYATLKQYKYAEIDKNGYGNKNGCENMNILDTLQTALLCDFLGLEAFASKFRHKVWLLLQSKVVDLSISELNGLIALVLENHLYKFIYLIQYRLRNFSIDELSQYPELYFLKYIQNFNTYKDLDNEIKQVQEEMDILLINYLRDKNTTMSFKIYTEKDVNTIKYILKRLVYYGKKRQIQIDTDIIYKLRLFSDTFADNFINILNTRSIPILYP